MAINFTNLVKMINTLLAEIMQDLKHWNYIFKVPEDKTFWPWILYPAKIFLKY